MAAIISNKKPTVPLSIWLARVRWQGARLARQLGLPILLAFAGLLLAAGLYWHGLEMAKAERQAIAETRRAEQQLKANADKPQVDPASADLARQIAGFYAFLPAHDAIPDQIKRLLASAEKHGVQLAQAQYRVQQQPNLAMLRYQIILPVKADYAKITAFLQSALQEMPSLTVESMQFKRTSIEAAELEARLQLVLLVQTKRSKVASHE